MRVLLVDILLLIMLKERQILRFSVSAPSAPVLTRVNDYKQVVSGGREQVALRVYCQVIKYCQLYSFIKNLLC